MVTYQALMLRSAYCSQLTPNVRENRLLIFVSEITIMCLISFQIYREDFFEFFFSSHIGSSAPTQ